MGQDKGFVASTLIIGVVGGVLCEQLAAHDLIASVYCTDLIGGDVRRLSSQGAETPVWSPEGDRILYVKHNADQEEGGISLQLISPQGEDRMNIALPETLGFTGGISWHPSGTNVALAAGRVWNGGYNIYTLEIGTSRNPVLVIPDGIQPAWAPNGSLLAFTTFRDENLEVYLADLQTGALRNLTLHDATDSRPSWAPDSKRVVFETNRFGNLEICTLDIQTGEFTRITKNISKDWNPVWSPNGQEIAFMSNRDGIDGIYRMSTDGTGITSLSHYEGDWQLNWSPDGKTLCFVSGRSGHFLNSLMRWFMDE